MLKYDLSFLSERKKLIFSIAVLMLIVGIVIQYVTSKKAEKHTAIPVKVATVTKDDFDYYLSALGTVTPEQTVTITSQVSGQIKKLHFEDGQNVKAGDLLIEIDPAAYQALLIQAEGQLARDIALLENAKLDLERYQKLWEQNSVSKQVLDTQKALVEQYVGTVELDHGLVEDAKVNLEYCSIKSPVTGKIGIGLIDEGNIVQSASQSTIAIVNTVAPITVIFYISEKYLPKILKNAANPSDLKVEAYNHDKTELLATGKLTAIDNQIDPTTGTIKLEATYANDDFKLFPNQFTNIKLYVETLKDILTIPTAAVQYNTKGAFVYSVNQDSKIEIRYIVTNLNADGKTVLDSGLGVGDVVVTEGTDKLTEGTAVSVPTSGKNSSTELREKK